jgi:MFS family permease
MSRGRGLAAVPTGVWVLGFGSLFMDASSELVHSLLPVFLTSVLGASMLTIGVLEGLAEATASVTKVFSGALSDRLGKRKLLLVLGYGLGAITKPIFPLATSVTWVFFARFVDRIGKGIRGAPRDALIADITPPALRGAAYGLRQSLDSVGAVIGPLMAVLLMAWLASDIRAVLWAAAVPAFICVALLTFAVREPERARDRSHTQAGITWAEVRQLPAGYWRIVGLGAAFTLARFSEAFLVLRAQDVGLAIGYVPAVMIVMSVVYAASAYPAGLAADRIPERWLLIAGLAVLVVADLVLASANRPLHVFIATAFWGLHLGLTQGLFAKLVADTASARLRGTAFGIFNLASGGALLLASVAAGALWSAIGPSATFLASALCAAAAAAGLAVPGRREPASAGSHAGDDD